MLLQPFLSQATCMQALQQLWEPARFTYQVNNPSSQSQRPVGRSQQPAAVADAEEEEADSSSSNDEGSLEQPQQTSQVMTRGAEARTDHDGARSVYIWALDARDFLTAAICRLEATGNDIC